MQRLSDSDAQSRLGTVPGWRIQGGALYRQFTFGGFPEAIAFAVRIGFVAEAADHHPEILVSYKRVSLTYVTHDAGGLTDKDFAGAAAAADVFAAGVGRSGARL